MASGGEGISYFIRQYGIPESQVNGFGVYEWSENNPYMGQFQPPGTSMTPMIAYDITKRYGRLFTPKVEYPTSEPTNKNEWFEFRKILPHMTMFFEITDDVISDYGSDILIENDELNIVIENAINGSFADKGHYMYLRDSDDNDIISRYIQNQKAVFETPENFSNVQIFINGKKVPNYDIDVDYNPYGESPSNHMVYGTTVEVFNAIKLTIDVSRIIQPDANGNKYLNSGDWIELWYTIAHLADGGN